jgi:8-hydroxy-5-deazaflavin:NADPH oxidoreductase
MKTKQTIAIIGATGNMGSAISRSLAKGNYRLLLKAGKPEEINKLVKQIKEGK